MMGQKRYSDGINAANKGAAGVSAGAAQLKTSIDTAKTGADSLAAGAKQVDEGVGQLTQSLSDMPETIKTNINKSLEPLNELNVGTLFKTLGYIDTDKITADNVSAAADAAVNNAGDIIDALTNMQNQNPSATYNQILVGLSQGKGAVCSIFCREPKCNRQCFHSASFKGWLSKGIRWCVIIRCWFRTVVRWSI